MFADTLGYIGGILLAIQFIPQITKVIKTKSTQDLSLLFMFTNTAGLICMLMFGILENNKPLYIPVSISLVNTIILIMLKFFFDTKSKNVKIEEIQEQL